jgi:uncharacterized protein (DUF927 family)
MARTLTARQVFRWRLLFLSAGEESLASLMLQAGRKASSGQDIRLADIDADAGAGMGAFQALHGQPNPSIFATAIKDAASKHYGAVGIQWLRRVMAERERISKTTTGFLQAFVKDCLPPTAAGQATRVAHRFGLVAAAGELATQWGLTGWEKGEAAISAKTCFKAWLESFGGADNRDERTIRDQVRAFFERYGTSRFDNASGPDIHPAHDRAGFYRNSDGESEGDEKLREYLVLPEPFKTEICKGLNLKRVTDVLLKLGWLRRGDGRNVAKKEYIPGVGQPRCYVFSSKMWDDPDPENAPETAEVSNS